ncbi:MAG: phytanoyl-CoA dioxygenase family protein [Planctomycetaceae bacterium]
MSASPTMPIRDLPYAVPPDKVAAYQREGWVRINGVLPPPEVIPFRNAISRHTIDFASSLAPLADRDTYGKAFIQCTNLWAEHDDVRAFSLAPRFAKIAADLMDVPAVRIYHDQALFKEPGGGLTPWHQDQQYWPLDGARCVTMWMPLVDCPREMGTMRFASGSQRLGYLGPLDISDRSEQRLERLIEEHGYPIEAAGDMRAGDATFHDGWCIHGAQANASTTLRAVMTVIYMEADAVVTEPDHPSREKDLRTWLPGLRAGDLAASPLNPVVWPTAG